jgi:hypothetical protein
MTGGTYQIVNVPVAVPVQSAAVMPDARAFQSALQLQPSIGTYAQTYAMPTQAYATQPLISNYQPTYQPPYQSLLGGTSLATTPLPGYVMQGGLPLSAYPAQPTYNTGYQTPQALTYMPVLTNPAYSAGYQQAPSPYGQMIPAYSTGSPAYMQMPTTAGIPSTQYATGMTNPYTGSPAVRYTPNQMAAPMAYNTAYPTANYMGASPYGSTYPQAQMPMQTQQYATPQYGTAAQMQMPMQTGMQMGGGMPAQSTGNIYADMLMRQPSTEQIMYNQMLAKYAPQASYPAMNAGMGTSGGMSGMSGMTTPAANNAGTQSDAAMAAAMYANSITDGQMGGAGVANNAANNAAMGAMAGMTGMGAPVAKKAGAPTAFEGGHTHDFVSNNGDNKIKSAGTTEFTKQFQEAHAKHYNGAGGTMMYDATGSSLSSALTDPNINSAKVTKNADGTIKAVVGVDTTLAGYRAAIDKVLADNKDIKTGTKEFYNKVGREVQNLNDASQMKNGLKQDGVDTKGITDTMLHWTGTAVINGTGMTKDGSIEVRGHQFNENGKFNDFVSTDINKDGIMDKVLVSRNDNGNGDTNNFNNGHNMGAGAVIWFDGKDASAPKTKEEAMKVVKFVDDDNNTGLAGGGNAVVDAIVAEGSYKNARNNGGKIADGTTTTQSQAAGKANAKYMPGMAGMAGAAGGMGAMGAMGGMGATPAVGTNSAAANAARAFGMQLTGDATRDTQAATAAIRDYYTKEAQKQQLQQQQYAQMTAMQGTTNYANPLNQMAVQNNNPIASTLYPGVTYPSTLNQYMQQQNYPTGLNTGYGSNIPTAYNPASTNVPYVVISGNAGAAKATSPAYTGVPATGALNDALHAGGVAHTHA